jgi:hypothetical protein
MSFYDSRACGSAKKLFFITVARAAVKINEFCG